MPGLRVAQSRGTAQLRNPVVNADEARIYVDAWVEEVSDDELDAMTDEEVIAVAEPHYARITSDHP